MHEQYGQGPMFTLDYLVSLSCIETKSMTAPIPGLGTRVTLKISATTRVQDSHLFNRAIEISRFKLQ